MRKRKYVGRPKLMQPGAVIGAVHGPGFSHDLSSWRLVIDEQGNLVQEVEVLQWTQEKGRVEEQRREHVEIGKDAVLQLLVKAREIGFGSYERSYQASVTDTSSCTLAVRSGDMDREVSVYGAEWMARQGNQDMIRFMELWNAIHRYAPFPPR